MLEPGFPQNIANNPRKNNAKPVSQSAKRRIAAT
jgi:hypothetical protein